MAFWRYLRDILIVVAVLLLCSGLVVSWWVLCLILWLAALLASVVMDSPLPQTWRKIVRRRKLP